jgi:hypothetical protein
MSKQSTHVLIEFPSQKQTLLYRLSDGMALGCRSGNRVLFGANPDPAKLAQRNFLDDSHALNFLRYCADLDANGFAGLYEPPVRREALATYANCEERDGESRLVSPNSQVISLK